VIHRFQKWIIGIGTVLMRLAGFEEGIWIWVLSGCWGPNQC
jgi:hypothetical protein